MKRLCLREASEQNSRLTWGEKRGDLYPGGVEFPIRFYPSYAGNKADIESDAGECRRKNEAGRNRLVAPVHFPAIQLSTTPNLNKEIMKLKPTIALLSILFAGATHAAPTFVNGLTLDGGMLDLSGGTTVNNGRLGYFSDIYYDTNRNEWWGLSDRGPGGGTLSYDTRVQRFSLDVDYNTGAISNFQIKQTVVFNNAGSSLNGIASSPTSTLGLSMDPEGFVVNPKTGNFLVSDEYGPSVREFDRNGNLLRTFATPANLLPRNTVSGITNYASDSGNRRTCRPG